MSREDEFKALKINLKYFHYKEIRDNNRRKIGTESFEEYETNSGKYDREVWKVKARELIDKYNENNIFNALIKYTENLGWFDKEKHSERIYFYALDLHISRIFENKSWVYYEKFWNERIR